MTKDGPGYAGRWWSSAATSRMSDGGFCFQDKRRRRWKIFGVALPEPCYSSGLLTLAFVSSQLSLLPFIQPPLRSLPRRAVNVGLASVSPKFDADMCIA